jgi:hypothetical protein
VPGNEEAATVPNVEGLSPRRFWRIRNPINQQNVRSWRRSHQKNKNYSVRSRNVYENKEDMDTMPDEKRTFTSIRHAFCRISPILTDNLPPMTVLERVFWGNCRKQATSSIRASSWQQLG